MRHVVAGLGEDGRSKIAEIREISLEREERWTDVLFTTKKCPPDFPAPKRDEIWMDLAGMGMPINPGGVTWITSYLPADYPYPGRFHCTDTVDLQLVMFGEVAFILEEEEIVLRAGDTIFNPGLFHAWRPGPEGCVIAAILLGLPPGGATAS